MLLLVIFVSPDLTFLALYYMPSVFSSSNLAAMEDTYFSLRMLVWYSAGWL